MQLTLLELIYLAAIVQLLIFSIFLLTLKRGNIKSYRWLAAFFLVQSTCICNSFLWKFFSYSVQSVPYLFFWADSILFLWGPFIYMYVRQMTVKTGVPFRKLVVHFIPFLLHLSYMTVIFHLLPHSEKTARLIAGNVSFHLEYIISTSVFNILVAIYLIMSLVEVYKYRNRLKNAVSDVEKLNLKWLFIFLYGYLIIWSGDALYFITGFFTQPPDFLVKYSYVYIFVMANFVVFFSLKQPFLFFTPVEKQKYSNSYLSDFLKDNIKEKLIQYMAAYKPYLNSSLTINDLADNLKVQPKYMSQIINECFSQNFFDFVNSYRINEAKRILSNPADNRNILQIIYDVGFNSKSAFNRAFLKFNNISPKEFKRQTNIASKN